MNFRQIKAFRAVMETGSVTRAAELLHLSQPAVSKLIASFEEAAGYRLFVRERNRLIATEEAVFLLHEADDVLIALDRLQNAIGASEPMRSSLIKIASLPGAANYVLPLALREVRSQGFTLRVQISTLDSSSTMRQYIASQQTHLAVMEAPEPTPEYDIIHVPQPIICILPKHDALAEKSTITPNDLAGQPLASVGSRHEPHDALVAAFADSGVKYQPQFEIQTHLPAVGLVAAGLAYGLIDTVNAWTLRHFLNSNAIVMRPFKPTVVEPLSICTPKLRPLPASAEALRLSLNKHLKICAKLSQTIRG